MFLREGRLDIMDLINSILGSLVSITGVGIVGVATGLVSKCLNVSKFQDWPEDLPHDG
jgi:hypothetical protein